MVWRSSAWLTSLGAAAVAAAGILSAGCGAYEPEPEFPQSRYVAPPPPTAAELAAQQEARERDAAASREIVVGADSDEYSDTDPSALTEFKPALDGHGTWVDDSSYGTVWVPAKAEVGDEFQPYVTAGHWTYSDATDYVWVSDYSWGWAPFHYGRWVLLPGHGWSWIPGRRYAGAWVTWRVGPSGYGYVGWAPSPPSWYWSGGAAYGWSFGWYNYHDHYVYCPHGHVYNHAVATHVVRGPAAREHYGRTQDYVPARPGVGGGDRVVANPSVGGGDRVVANPSVGGGDRVVANPSVGGGGRVVASPEVGGDRVASAGVPAHRVAGPGVGGRGPRPDELGLKNETVVAPPSSNEGLGRAQALASPTTAVAIGAAPPAQLRPSSASAIMNPAGVAAVGRGPASSSFVPGSSRAIASPPSAPRLPNDAPRVSSAPSYRSSPSFDPSPPVSSYRSSPPVVRSSPAFDPSPPVSSYRSSPPVVRSSPVFGSAPTMGSSPSVSSPSPVFRSPPPVARSSPSPSFGSSPSVGSSPSFRASPSVGSSPSFRASPSVGSSPSFRSSPSVRSSPSIGSVRSSSSPSRSSIRSGGTRR